MARPSISTTKLNEHLSVSECHPDYDCRTNNWWVYDKRAGRNIGFRALSRDAALVEAIDYWAKRALIAETCYADIKSSVDLFVTRFSDVSEDEE